MNKCLCISSLILGSIIFLFLCHHQPPCNILNGVLILGIVTSIWNHTVSYKPAKYIDRGVVTIAVFVIVWYTLNSQMDDFMKISLIGLVVLSVSCFFIAKKRIHKIQKRDSVCDLLHFMCHFGVTIVVIVLLTQN